MRQTNNTKKEREFTAFFEENELGGYTITIPSLPGLVTEIRDMREAKKVLQDAISCYIDGLKKSKLEIPDENYVVSMKLAVPV